MHSQEIVKLLFALTEKTKSGPSNFIIEATERKMMEVDIVNPTLKSLRSKGIKIAIDDFGTGYSSLSYLEELKVDFLKIDKSFIDAMGTDASTSHVIFHIIEMAKPLNLKIIAEGIENKEQKELIREHGVHFGQGFLYGSPMTLEVLLARLKSNE